MPSERCSRRAWRSRSAQPRPPCPRWWRFSVSGCCSARTGRAASRSTTRRSHERSASSRWSRSSTRAGCRRRGGGCATVAVPGDAALDRRRRRHRRDHRLLRAPAVRPVVGRGVPARLGGRVDRRGGSVRDAAAHAASPRHRAHARGGVGRQRPGRDRPDARTDRLDRAAALRRRRPRRPARASRSASGSRSGSRSVRSRRGSSHASRRRSRRSRRSHPPPPRRSRSAPPTQSHGSGFLSRVPRRPRRRVDAVALPRAARHVPRGRRLRRAGRPLHRPRAARLPVATCRTSRSPGLGLAAALMFVARPVAVWASTPFVGFSARERALLGWAGFAAPCRSCSATFVLSSHVSSADTIFNAVFFVVLVSVVLQGTTLEWLATRLGLVASTAPSRPPLEVDADRDARPGGVPSRRRPRDRRRRRPRARPAARDTRRRRRSRRRRDPAARQHAHRGRRRAVRARPAREARARSRTCSSAGGDASRRSLRRARCAAQTFVPVHDRPHARVPRRTARRTPYRSPHAGSRSRSAPTMRRGRRASR